MGVGVGCGGGDWMWGLVLDVGVGVGCGGWCWMWGWGLDVGVGVGCGGGDWMWGLVLDVGVDQWVYPHYIIIRYDLITTRFIKMTYHFYTVHAHHKNNAYKNNLIIRIKVPGPNSNAMSPI